MGINFASNSFLAFYELIAPAEKYLTQYLSHCTFVSWLEDQRGGGGGESKGELYV